MVGASFAARTYTLHHTRSRSIVEICAHAHEHMAEFLPLRFLTVPAYKHHARWHLFKLSGMPSHRLLLALFAPLAVCFLLACAQLECPRWRGSLRDCTCGVIYRDEEVRCCTPDTCVAPQLISRNLSCPLLCPFLCLNGGVFDAEQRRCSCPLGFYGLCCEQGQNHSYMRKVKTLHLVCSA